MKSSWHLFFSSFFLKKQKSPIDSNIISVSKTLIDLEYPGKHAQTNKKNDYIVETEQYGLQNIVKGDEARDSKNFGQAAHYYREAIRVLSNRNDIRIQLGNMLKDSGDIRGAIKEYLIVISTDAANDDAFLQYGHALKLAGYTERAFAAYKESLRLKWSLDALSETMALAAKLNLGTVGLHPTRLLYNQDDDLVIDHKITLHNTFYAGNNFKVTGIDPWMEFKPNQLVPRGWYAVIVIADLGLDNPKIYVDFGDGYSEDDTFYLYPTAGEYRNAVWFVSEIKAIRFDPFERGTEFRIKKLALYKLDADFLLPSAANLLVFGDKSEQGLGSQSSDLAIWPGNKKLVAIQSEAMRPLYNGLYFFNQEDYYIVKDIIRKQRLPKISALVFVQDEDAAALDKVISALDKQIYSLQNIFIHIDETSPIFAYAKTIASAREDIFLTSMDVGGALRVDCLLLLAATVEPVAEATAVLGCHLLCTGAQFLFADEIIVDLYNSRRRPFFKATYSTVLSNLNFYIGNAALIKLNQDCIAGQVESLISMRRQYDRFAESLTALAKIHGAAGVSHIPIPIFMDHDAERLSLLHSDGPHRIVSAGLRVDEFGDLLASIIIPTRDGLSFLETCVKSIMHVTNTSRDLYEIIIVDNGSVEQKTIDYLEDGKSKGWFRVMRDDGNFNYSRLNNNAARLSNAQALVFLNNDTIIIQPDWLTRLIETCLGDNVGAVGVKLLYEDTTVQHSGVVLGIQGVAAHIDVGLDLTSSGYFGLSRHDREVSAVTGACLAVSRTRFWNVGGFREQLAVAFNDTMLCIDLFRAGLSNIQLNTVTLVHLESKSRGYDDKPEKRRKFLQECKIARGLVNNEFLFDKYYNGNLSLQDTYKDALVKRTRKPWRSSFFSKKPRILILSSTHRRGHGVPVVINEHVKHFVGLGLDVIVGGPIDVSDYRYNGCTRVHVDDAFEAALLASSRDVDIIIPHTPPFFSVARWTGPFPIVAIYDHGEPPSDFFPDKDARNVVLEEKSFVLSLAHRRYCNSESVKLEAGFDDMIVVPLGNSHMSFWQSSLNNKRNLIRSRLGWSDKTIVLNVCRFHEAERYYKGIDVYIELASSVFNDLSLADEVLFVLCGKGTPEDVEFVEKSGIKCFANLRDDELHELYVAADLYCSFSKWEGWNLGIAQALAYGLPVIASDIEAHKNNFDVYRVSDVDEAKEKLNMLHSKEWRFRLQNNSLERKAILIPWGGILNNYSSDLLEYWKSYNPDVVVHPFGHPT